MPKVIPVPKSKLKKISETGLLPGTDYPVCNTIAEAKEVAGAKDRLLVITASGSDPETSVFSDGVPLEQIENVNPWVPPVSIVAGGGYLVRDIDDVRNVLMIFRRNIWDLPKGKREAGESPVQTACREVCEELGIDEVTVLRSLGTTRHSYRLSSKCVIKTTYWFLMTSTAESFTPQIKEQIERAKWFPFDNAPEVTGFDSLRNHMNRVGDLIQFTPLS